MVWRQPLAHINTYAYTDAHTHDARAVLNESIVTYGAAACNACHIKQA